MIDFPILSLLTFLPLVGALFILTIRGDALVVARNARFAALYTSLFTFALSLYMMNNFDGSTASYQFVEKSTWFPGLNIGYHMGVDGLSMFFVVLSAFLTPICILASWTSITSRVKEYMVAFLVLETFMIGTFCALDAVLFYAFFEGVLIPMFLIIGIWGGKRRVYSAYKFFLYTLLGSVLMLVALLYMYFQAGTTDIPTLMEHGFPRDVQFWLWLAFFASFAVKMPMWPVHTWLPDAHVEAPTAGSVILAGVLLKMGGYGFLRFSIPMLPEATEFFAPMVFGLSIIAIIYTSLVALVQDDMKKLIAYSSVAHMGYVTLGLFTMTAQGIQGGIFQMISHGIVSAALFLCVGVVYDRLHTREISRYGGVVKNMPKYAVVFMIFMLGSVGLPGTSGFVGEFLALLGAYRVDTLVAVLATTGLILGAPYMLILYRRVIFGPQVNEDAAEMLDMNWREIVCLVPLAILTIWLGVFPNMVLNKVQPSVDNLISRYEADLSTTDVATTNTGSVVAGENQ
ncbi:NADH-quinone oxidoreductase subunit M [Micavibrio aeruginosavorus]|uniref:Proton-translocating NADH-quinone oxidoreductase, chain M family protein n=1 Tax=Micavibrio aeruginosavorus (strain ARL-13) TaxID=856793 RepID=G2KSS4_MICAA|nr:NADH-quinone oxidoreductase subunit M [Micavibrio aeruginosavorus]AEP09674.1 proton-translocating NADH-quinone oxidoreductase, chain M family protein [Micavibrio aeruginosavorus ARL-13]